MNLGNDFKLAQELFLHYIKEVIRKNANEEQFKVDREVTEAFRQVVVSTDLCSSLKVRMLTLPTLVEIGEEIKEELDFEIIFRAREFVQKSLAVALEFELIFTYDSLRESDDFNDRRFKYLCLEYLSELGNRYENVVLGEYFESKNIMDSFNSLQILCDMARCCQAKSSHTHSLLRQKALEDFYLKWKGNDELINKWRGLQARSIGNGTLERVVELEKDLLFNKNDESSVYALYLNFGNNLYHFHREEAYDFFAERVIEIDNNNSVMAARLMLCYEKVPSVIEAKQKLMINAIKKVIDSSPSQELMIVAQKIHNSVVKNFQ
ncbi:MAG: aminopeptidase N C-terminal domain-containing protein [Lentisphaeria bacterium]